MDIFRSEIKTYKKKVEQRLKIFLDKEKKQARKISPFLAECLERLEEFTLRSSSKRIRAFLVKVGYEAVKGKIPSALIDVSVAIELIHSYLLIHDDVIDQDEWRRKGITVHKYFERYHQKKLKKGNSEHFGISMAILTGNIGCYLANSLISQSKLPSVQKAQAIDRVSRLLVETNYGEALDVYHEMKSSPSDKRDILLIHRYKTSKYSFEAPLHLGAILAGARQKQLAVLTRYAIPAGLAFQISDDILGVFGSQEEIGKPVDSDIKEGKQTLLYFKALENLRGKNKIWLTKQYGRKDLNERQIARIGQLFIDSGSLEYYRKLVNQYLIKARNSLQGSRQIRPKSVSILLLLTNYLGSRKR